MKKYLLLFLLAIQYLSFSQCSDASKYDLGGSYMSRSSNYIPFNYLPENPADSISYGIDIKRIQKYAAFVFDKAKQYIVNRAGKRFYDRLEFYQLEVNYHNIDIHTYEDTALYELSNFDHSYWMIYTYRSKGIEYAFGLEFDSQGKMISENKFPAYSNNRNFEDFIDICDAVLLVKSLKKFKDKKVDFIELDYLEEADSFCWLIQEEKAPNKELGKYEEYVINLYYVNANTLKLEAVKEKKGVSIACGAKLKNLD